MGLRTDIRMRLMYAISRCGAKKSHVMSACTSKFIIPKPETETKYRTLMPTEDYQIEDQRSWKISTTVKHRRSVVYHLAGRLTVDIKSLLRIRLLELTSR